MSSVNDYIIDYIKPTVYLSFENDQYDSAGISQQGTNPFIIPDDSGNSNHAQCYDFPVASMNGYKLGEKPIYELGTDQNKSILFGHYYKNSSEIRSYVSIPNTDTLSLKTNEYTCAFYMKMDGSNTTDYPFIIAQRIGMFNIWQNRRSNYSDNNKINFDFFYRNRNGELKSTTLSMDHQFNNKFGKFVVIRCKMDGSTMVVDVNVDGFYVTGTRVDTNDGGLDINNTAPLTLAGSASNPANGWSQGITYPIYFEHLLYVDRYINGAEINNIIKRSKQYDTIVASMTPFANMDCQDNDSLNQNSVKISLNQYAGKSITGISKLGDMLTPVNKAYTSIRFDGFTNVEFLPEYYDLRRGYSMTSSQNLSITFWIKVDNTNKSTILHGISPVHNYEEELRLEVNSNSFNHRVGSLCFSDEAGQVVNSTGVFVSDNQWHHIAITYTASKVSMYIDGVLQGSYNRKNKKNYAIAYLSLMADINNKNNTAGNLSFFNMFNHTLTHDNINLLYSYSFYFSVDGSTRMWGLPKSAEVRLYNYWSGELLDKKYSDSNGKYEFILDSGSYVLLNALLTNDASVIPKIFAPILPRINHIER